MANQHLKQYAEEKLPYVDFLRTYNENTADERRDVPWRCYLFDKKGGPFTWCDESQIQYYVAKGWKVVEYGNFEIRKPDGSAYKELIDIEPTVAAMTRSHQAILAAQAEAEAARKELEELRAEKEKLAAEKAQAETEVAKGASAKQSKEASR